MNLAIEPGASGYLPQAASTPPSYTAKPNDTVQSVAQTYKVTPEELARSNGIHVDAALSPGQVLQLPHNAVQPVKTDAPQDKPQTPAQKTDSAIGAYQQALKNRTEALKNAPQNMGVRSEVQQEQNATVSKAKDAMDKAIKSEIDGEVASRNQGVPPEYRTPTDQLIKHAGDAIAARHKDDPAAQALVKDDVADKQLQARADAFIPGYYGDWSAKDKLAGINLQGQPQAVIDKVLADPRVQGWLKDAAAEAGKQKDPAASAQYLADMAKGMPPAEAQQLMQQWWSATDGNGQPISLGVTNSAVSDPAIYKNLAAAYAAMGDGPQAQTLRDQIAGTIAGQMNNSTMADGTFSRAIIDGADPKLALDVAAHLQANGKSAEAQEMMGSICGSIYGLQKSTLKNDMQAYAKQTEELNELIKNLGPGLTDAQKQKAIKAYVDGKGKDWQNDLKEKQAKIVADVKTLDTDIAALKHLPPELQQKYGDLAKGYLDKIGGDEATQQAVEFAASQDPSVFEGEQGGEAAVFWVEVGHKSKDLVAAVSKAYITGHVLPALSDINPNDPASVAKARQTLEDFRATGAKILGVPQAEVDRGVNKLESVLGSLKKESIEDAINGKGINALGATEKELGELKEMTFSNAGAGMAFRAMAFGLSGAALLNSAQATVDDPKLQNLIGTFAYSVGFAQDAAGFGATLKLLDKEGAVANWGLGASMAGRVTEKFLGALNVAYFAVGAYDGATDGNLPKAIFSGAGAVGAGLAAFGGEEILGGLAGPIGMGIVLVATVALGLIEHHEKQKEYNEAADKFLEGAGVEDAGARKQLIDAGPDQLIAMRNRGISPEDIQEIAKNYPEAMHIAYGNDPQGRPY